MPVQTSTPASSAGTSAEGQSRIQVTAADHERLSALIDSWLGTRDEEAAEALAEELERAEIVPVEQIAGNVVTMNSRVLFEDSQSAERREVSLVYPQDSDASRGRISVLAPIGTALLGLAVGQTIEWPLPGGQRKQLRIVEVIYQPEQAGHFHL